MKVLNYIAAILLIVGGLNWGLVGLADFNLVTAIFHSPAIERIVYILVGLSAIWWIVNCRKSCCS